MLWPVFMAIMNMVKINACIFNVSINKGKQCLLLTQSQWQDAGSGATAAEPNVKSSCTPAEVTRLCQDNKAQAALVKCNLF